MFSFHGHIFHVGRFHVHVFGSDVFAIKAVYKFSETAQKGFRFHSAGIANDDGLATAQVKTADGGFGGALRLRVVINVVAEALFKIVGFLTIFFGAFGFGRLRLVFLLAAKDGAKEITDHIALDALDAFRPRPLKRGEPIGLGAVVELEDGDCGRTLFLAPVGAGVELTGPGGDGFLSVVTPHSPIGKAVLGRRVGESIEVTVEGEPREWTITYAS